MGQNRRFCNRYILIIYRSPDIVVGRESRLWPERPRSRGWIPGGGSFFSSPELAGRLSVQYILLFIELVKVEVNVTPWYACASREGGGGGQLQPICNLALGASGWSGRRPGRFTSGKDAIPSVEEARGRTSEEGGGVMNVTENVDSTGVRTTSRPARNESLCRQCFHRWWLYGHEGTFPRAKWSRSHRPDSQQWGGLFLLRVSVAYFSYILGEIGKYNLNMLDHSLFTVFKCNSLSTSIYYESAQTRET